MIHLLATWKKENLMEKPLFDEEHDNKEIENIDALLHIERQKWDISCFYFDGDPIYDTDDDVLKIRLQIFGLVDNQTQSRNVKPTS
jgi:hypothetical protein